MPKKLTTEEFIEKAKKVHGDKYDYSKVVYVNNRTKVCIICPEHGEFWQVPNSHLNGNGCSECCGLKKWTTEMFIEKAREVHGDKYDYSKTEYINKRTNVIITCPIHGDFSQNPHNHISQKQGCPECGKIVAQKREGNYKNKRKTTEEFKKDLFLLYGDKYEMMDEYINNKTPVKIYCHNKNSNGEEHGIFITKPNDLICGHGCKKCYISNLENEIECFLQENNIKYQYQQRFKWLKRQSLDFYLPEYNVAIECQGEQHFKPVDFAGKGKTWAINNFKKIKILDKNKYNLCKENKIKILYYNSSITNRKIINTKEKLLNEIKKYENKKQRKNN